MAHNNKLSFLKNTIILMLGKTSTQVISFLLVPLYTAFISASDYGLVDIITTYTLLILPIVTVHIELAAFRFLIDKRENPRYINSLQKTITSFTFVMTMIAIIGATILNAFIQINLFPFIATYFILTIFFNLFQNFARGQGRNLDFSIASLIYGLVNIVTSIITIVVLRLGATGLLISYILSALSGIIYLAVRLHLASNFIKTKLTKAERSEIRQYLKYSAPLVPGTISWWVLNVSDRTIIMLFISTAANGIYAISNKFSSLFIGFFNMLNLSMTEYAALHIKNDSSTVSYLSERIFKYLSVFASVILLAVQIIYPAFVAEAYKDSFYYVPILMLSAIFTVGLGLTQNIYIALKKTKQVANTAVACAILNIIINLTFIKVLGLYAAALSTCISCFTLFIYRWIDLKKYTEIRFKFIDFKVFIAVASAIIVYYTNMSVISVILIIILITITLILNKNQLKSIKRILYNKIHNGAK